MIFGFIAIPWCIKPAFGYLLDQLIRKVKYTKLIVVCAEFTRFLMLTTIVHYDLNPVQFYLMLFVNSLCTLFINIICEYTLVKSSKLENEKNNKSNSNHLGIFFGFRSCGSLIAGICGGRVVHYFSIRASFMCCSFFPLLTILASLFYRELPLKPMSAATSFSTELQIMKDLIFRDKVFQMMIFICLINFTPNFDTISTFYMTDKLGFSTEDLANFSTISTLAYILGLALYTFYLIEIDI